MNVNNPSYIKRYALILVVAWSIIVLALLFLVTIRTNEEKIEYAHIYTTTAFEKDILYRRWVTMHGGVYVPVTNKTPPNPYLSEIPERDIITPSGKQLTLINPAYMTRQVYEFGSDEVSDARSHLTSLKTIRPENAPDEWEKNALVAFDRGEKEISSIENIGGREYFRLMKPFIIEQGCLRCHAKQGYKLNDIRGGISVSLPMDSIEELAGISLRRTISMYLLLWFIGTGGIVFGYYRVSKSEAKRNQAETKLEKAYLDMEKKVQDRTAKLSQVNETLQKEITERKNVEKELTKHRDHLEELVKERTTELNTKNEELERFNKLFVGRELKMIELKKKIAEKDKRISDLEKEIIDHVKIPGPGKETYNN